MVDYELRPEDIIHKSYLNRALIEIVDQPYMAQFLGFKGGTCATMLGYLDRFSIDLDFDAFPDADEERLRKGFIKAFEVLDLELTKAFDQVLFFQARYKNEPGKRNKLKVSANTEFVQASQYQPQYFSEVDRFILSQTIDTMVAHKLIAVMDRYQKHQSIAGRDIYDIHHFLLKGYPYNPEVIKERTGKDLPIFFKDLISFIKIRVNETLINEDLNTLLPQRKFQQIRKILIPETLFLLNRELEKVSDL